MDLKKYEPTKLESVASNPATTAAATSLAVVTGGLLAALLPALTNALASGRHADRINLFMQDVNAILEEHADLLKDLTDSQYELINNAVMAALHTLDTTKIKYLRVAVRNILGMEIDPLNSAYIARVIRDISAEEAEFLIRTSDFSQLAFGPDDSTPELLMVDPESPDARSLDGLVSLGVVRVQAGFGGGVLLKTSSCETLCSLLSGD